MAGFCCDFYCDAYASLILSICYSYFSIVIVAGIMLDGILFESPRFLLTNIVNVEAATKVMNKVSLANGEGNFTYTLVSENPRKKGIWSLKDIFELN